MLRVRPAQLTMMRVDGSAASSRARSTSSAPGTLMPVGMLMVWYSSKRRASSTVGKVADYFWHLVLPVTALVIGGFATLTILTKNSFLNEITRQYVVTARAKGLSERRMLYGQVFRNAMLLVISGIPQAFISVFFAGSLLIEVIFSLDGLGRMSYEAAVSRDYPVVFGSLFIFTLFGLLIKQPQRPPAATVFLEALETPTRHWRQIKHQAFLAAKSIRGSTRV